MAFYERLTITECLTAIDETNKNSAPATDAIRYKLLSHMSNAEARGLLGHISRTLESSNLPAEWKDAEVRLILKPGKPLTIENMRPVSIRARVGKVKNAWFPDDSEQTWTR